MKRHVALQPTSREHHFGLLLGWKIREGFKRKVAPERIKKYTDWFWENHLMHHFLFEEKYIFPILEDKHPFVKRALREHRRLRRLFTAFKETERYLYLIEEELTAHIRFEERILFKEVENLASPTQLALIEREHSKKMITHWEDEFWV